MSIVKGQIVNLNKVSALCIRGRETDWSRPTRKVYFKNPAHLEKPIDKLSIKFKLESLWQPISLTERAFLWFVKTLLSIWFGIRLLIDGPAHDSMVCAEFISSWLESASLGLTRENLCFSSYMVRPTHLTESIWKWNQRYYLELIRIKWVLWFSREPPCYHVLILFRVHS